MGKDNFTEDGRHMQFGETDDFTNPPGFNAPDNASFQPQPFGRVMDDVDNGACIDRDATSPE